MFKHQCLTILLYICEYNSIQKYIIKQMVNLLRDLHTKVLQEINFQINALDITKEYLHDFKYKELYLYIHKYQLPMIVQ